MDYREIRALNQSTLKKILTSPQSFLQAVKKMEAREASTEEHFILGSAIDLMLTSTREEFNSKFAIVPDDMGVTDAVKTILDNIYEELLEAQTEIGTWDSQRNIILKHVKFQNYQGNWKDDTRIDAMIKAGNQYMLMKELSEGKSLISHTDYAKATNCTMALRGDKFTAPYCVKKAGKNIDIIDKFIVAFEHKLLNFKGELDRVIIDHNTQTIQPIDFKSTGKTVGMFNSDFWKYRYDFQAAVYTLGLTKHPEIKELIDKGYKLLNFLYIVVETELYNSPMVFEVYEEVLKIGLEGGQVFNREYEGFEQAILRYKYAHENSAWEYPMEYYQLNGKMPIIL
jgi:hypothetical protein